MDGLLCCLYLLLQESGQTLVRCPEPKGCCGRCRKLGSLGQQAQLSGSGLGEGAHSRKYGSSHSTIFFMMGGHYMPLVCKSQQKVRGDWEELIGILVSCIVSWSWYKSLTTILKNGSLNSDSFVRCLDLG